MGLTRQDEKSRQRRRLQDRAIDLASRNRWAEAVEVNQQIIELEEDADAYNRLGKAYFELGRLHEAHAAYSRALQLTPTNSIARKNIERLEAFLARPSAAAVPDRSTRQLVDLRTTLTHLVDVPRSRVVEAIVTGERVDLRQEGRNVIVVDADGNVIGRLEPKLAQRLSELMAGGNRYAAAVAQSSGNHLRVLIRETYQDPSQRGRVSFPGKFGESALRSYIAASYDDYGDEFMEEESVEEHETEEEETFNGEEEELGLDDIEQDIGDEEDISEE
jgi:tetratricopeptide (TPR) repeat protein